MSPTTRAWLQIHACVVLWGFTAILGRLITLDALPLVWWRMTLVAGGVALAPAFWRGVRPLSARTVAVYAGIGAIVALHWLSFYGAVKLANASVAATCIALAPVFTAFVEPALTSRRFERRELLLGLVMVPGVALVVGGTPVAMRAGIVVGTISSLLVAIFVSLNKRVLDRARPLAVTGIEMGAGAVLLALVGWAPVPLGNPFARPGVHDVGLLLLLAFGCTLLPFALSLVAMRHLSGFGATLAVNLEPVYAILLAIPLLGEQRELEARFYVGAAIILGTVFAHPLLTRRQPDRPAAG